MTGTKGDGSPEPAGPPHDNVVAFRRPGSRPSTRTRPPRAPRAGVDFVYAAYGDGRRPVRWDPTRPIAVRPHGDMTENTTQALTSMVEEIAAATRLPLYVASRDAGDGPTSTDSGVPPEQTITVSEVALGHLARICGLHPAAIDGLCNGHTRTTTDRPRRFYTGAAINLLASPGGVEETARALRHHLGHALGLGHCRSPERLMHLTPRRHVSTWTETELEAVRSLHFDQTHDNDATPMCFN